MLYRPNFCCECGEKIERANWPLLASRRFCDLCQTRHLVQEWLPMAIAIASLTIGTACILSVYQRPPQAETASFRPVDPPTRKTDKTPQSDLNATPPSIGQSQTEQNTGQTPRPTNPLPETLKSAAPTKDAEPVYYCGAATKKGTPCTRRVKKSGERCWQHQGMPSMAEGTGKLSR
jgi:hypothetical protein